MKSKIWTISRENLEKLVNASISFAEILRVFNLDISSGNYRTLKRRLKFDQINFDHIKTGKNSNKGRKFHSNKKKPLNEILIEHSQYSSPNLKKRLIKENLLINKCYECGMLPEWNGKYLCLQLDHKNGRSDDNRIENLRLLCPNCHSQTNNYAARNRIIKVKDPKPSELNPKWRSASRPNSRKVERPSKEDLEKLLWEIPTSKLAKQFGVSDKAIEKWSKAYGLTKPPRGYWQGK